MLTRALLLVAGLSACSSAPRAVAPPRLFVVPCGELVVREGVGPPTPGEADTTVLGRSVALVGDTVVVAGEARGVFVIDGQPRRCPSSPSVLLLGRSRAGAARFAWCVASPAPFPSLAATSDGFALAGRIARDAAPEAAIDAASPANPSKGAEEVSVLRFAADGTLRGRTTLSRGPGSVAALAVLADGALMVEGTAVRLPPEPLVVEHFLSRVDPQGAASELEARREVALGAPAVELVHRPAGGLFRAGVERDAIIVEVLGDGDRRFRANVPAAGTVVDLAAVAGAGDDDVWLAWSLRLGRGDAARWERRVARVSKNGNVNERALGNEGINAHVYGLIPLGPDRAAVLFQVWKERGQAARFGAVQLDPKAHLGAAALVAYDIPGNQEVALTVLGDDVVALGITAEPGAAVLTGWFRGALRAPSGPVLGEHRCGLFVGTVPIDEARWR